MGTPAKLHSTTLQELHIELAATMGTETLAHDAINAKDLTEDQIVKLAQDYIDLRKKAWAVV